MSTLLPLLAPAVPLDGLDEGSAASVEAQVEAIVAASVAPAPVDAKTLLDRTRALLLEPGRFGELRAAGIMAQLNEALVAEDRVAEAALRLLRGCLWEREGALPRAVADLVHACQLFSAQGEVEGEILGTWRLGVVWSRAGDIDNAARAHEFGLTLARAHGYRLYEGILVFNLGFSHGAQNEPVQYRVLTEQALAIFTELASWDRVAMSLCNLGGALVGLGALDEAEAAYDKAQPVAESSNLVLALGLIEGGRGELAFKRGDLADGVRRTEAAAAWFGQHGLHYDAVRQTHLTARGLLEGGVPERAIRVLRAAYQAAEHHGFRSLVVQSAELLAEAYAAAGAHADAYSALRNAWALRTEILRAESQQRYVLLRDAQEASAVAHQALRSHDLAMLNRQLREAQANQQALRQVLEDQRRLDPLTQLLNRRGLAEGLRQAQQWAREHEAPLAVVTVVVADLKYMNETVGHAAGDRVLNHIANRLRAESREGDLVARTGGDAFAVVLRGADDGRTRAVAARVAGLVGARPMDWNGRPVSVRVSVSVAAVALSASMEAVLANAETARAAQRLAEARQPD